MAGTRVDQATGQLAAEGVVQAGLVATDAGVDFVAAALGGLVDEIRVGEERTGHGDHVGIALGQHLLGHLGGVDAVGGDQRDLHLAAQLGGDLGEGRARHFGGDGGDARLVPADAGVDEGGAGRLDGLGQGDDLLPGAAAFHQVEHGQAEDDDEVRAHGLAHAADDLHRQAHAVLVAAAPAVGALVGVGGEELVDEVPLRPHDLDAVVLGLLGQLRAGDEVLDLLFDALFVQLVGLERVDRRLDGRGRHLLGVIGVATGMEDLHADLAVRFMHRAGHDAVLLRLFHRGQLGRAGVDAAFGIRADAAGHHQADAATGTLGEIGGHALETVGFLFQAGVHRPHQGTVAQGGEAQVEGCEQVRVTGVGHGASTTVSAIHEVPRHRGPGSVMGQTIKSGASRLNDRN
ncbi:hypothetical protein D3C80_832180 [compost metagenome]